MAAGLEIIEWLGIGPDTDTDTDGHLGVTVFDGPAPASAADLIAAGLLPELKTGLGDRHPDSGRRCGLETSAPYQMLGYVLLDFDDEYDIDSIGLYSARYGHLATWPLRRILGGYSADRPEATSTRPRSGPRCALC